MIYTSSHNNWKTDLYKTYAISGNRGKDANYKGKYYQPLAPKLSFWKVWHDNIGKIPEEENNKYYIQKYWEDVLSKLDPEKVYQDLNYSVLLCYETNEKFCHRHIVAAWFELVLGEEIPEIKLKNNEIEYLDRPKYIKQYLEDIIRTNKNMRGFKSLRTLFLFEKAERLEEKANMLEKQNKNNCEIYRQAACDIRCEADEEESKYIQKILKKTNSNLI